MIAQAFLASGQSSAASVIAISNGRWVNEVNKVLRHTVVLPPQNIVVPCRSLPKKDNINCDGDVKFVIPNPPTAIDVSQWGHKFVVYPWCLGQVDAALGASVAQREGRGYSKNIIHLYYGDGRTPISLYHLLLEGRNMDEHQCSVLFFECSPPVKRMLYFL